MLVSVTRAFVIVRDVPAHYVDVDGETIAGVVERFARIQVVHRSIAAQCVRCDVLQMIMINVVRRRKSVGAVVKRGHRPGVTTARIKISRLLSIALPSTVQSMTIESNCNKWRMWTRFILVVVACEVCLLWRRMRALSLQSQVQ